MALEIREDRGVLELYGKVTSENLGAIRIYFDSVLELAEVLIISLEGISEMDSSAAYFFEELYRKGAEQNRIVSIIGRQNIAIEDVMKITKTHYILSADRV